MINNKKIIGVCLTKIHDTTRSNYIKHLHKLALEKGYKLIIFNSFVDFFNNDSFDEGAQTIYNTINYDIIDALIVFSESFCNKEVSDKIISDAKSHNVPVVLINEAAEGCYSIIRDYEDAFKSIIRHIVKDHGVTDTFFIAGKKDNDKISDKRINFYKEVLEENGIAFDESKIGYGEYWEWPTKAIMYELVQNGNKPPRAIICANDAMAFAVCEILTEYGYKIPDDVIVTGFDGVPASTLHSPCLTTCYENLEGFAQLSIQAVDEAINNELPCRSFNNPYIPCISESCGCRIPSQYGFRKIASDLNSTIDKMERHEDMMYSWINRMLKIIDMNTLYTTLAGSILENSFVCLKNDFISFVMGTNREKTDKLFSDRMVVINSKYSHNKSGKTGTMQLTDMVPYIDEWIEDDTSYILSAIYVKSEVCGYYAVKTNDITNCRHMIKRVLNTINIAFNVIINHFRQISMRLSIENAALTNSITDLPNLKGVVKWYEEFSSIAENHEKAISISVYGLPKYTYIYENYGISDVEEALRFVAEALKIANPANCFIGHIAEDEFVIVNYYNDPNDISDTINSATSAFFNVIEGFNNQSGKDYFVEVNCGCTVAFPGWSGPIEGFIKFANNEMYMNRLKSGIGSAVKEQSSPKEHYKAFELLIEKNLFNYHFQPIIDARSGEIYAYEALMRTDSSIGMNPLEILEIAKKYNRLYDVEKATMFNVMERYSAMQETFGDKKVFINTIPGHFLNKNDINSLVQKYEKYMDRVVLELTEQDTVSDEELKALKLFSNGLLTSQIAIDDYGTGHSNIVNLMRYSPQVIKIDRFLVSEIHKNKNKQMFVRSTIEFARMNNIKVLAEGVETSNELRMVIDLGVDLIQGYYTGRPLPNPIPNIDSEIRKEIIESHPSYYKHTT